MSTGFANRFCQQNLSTSFVVNRFCQQVLSTGFVNRFCQQFLSTVFVNRFCQQVLSTGFVNRFCQQVLSTGFEQNFTNLEVKDTTNNNNNKAMFRTAWALLAVKNQHNINQIIARSRKLQDFYANRRNCKTIHEGISRGCSRYVPPKKNPDL